MPRLPKLFARKPPVEDQTLFADPLDEVDAAATSRMLDAEQGALDMAPGEATLADPMSAAPTDEAAEAAPPPATASADPNAAAALDTAPAQAPDETTTEGEDDGDRRAQGESKTLIGGREADLVPLIPDTEIDQGENTTDLDEEAIAMATIEALNGACTLMIARVRTISKQQDGTQIIAGLIALVSDLDVRYAEDWGVVRRNGLEEVLFEVRESMGEGDRFILESLENGRGGLTGEVFLRDLRTIAPADRSRMIASYAMFLIFVLRCVLRQYLRPLEEDPARLRGVVRGLDYLIDGVRDTLLARINGIPRMG